MTKLLIFDFEVFKYDTLLGCVFLDENYTPTYYQTWDREEIKRIYNENKEIIWIGHNNQKYDNLILQAIIRDENEKEVNDRIIIKRENIKFDLSLYYYDLMTQRNYSVKTLEGFFGRNIHESEVDFNLNRPLMEEEKNEVEFYNKNDLEQEYDDFLLLSGVLIEKLAILNHYNFSLTLLKESYMKMSSLVLHAHKIIGIENQQEHRDLPSCLQVKNQQVLDYYFQDKYRTDEKLKVDICGLEHTIGTGGIHASRDKYYSDEVYYLDVSGYYNLIMLNYDLLPRSVNEKNREYYEWMYKEQLKLKGDPTKSLERTTYKELLLSVYGAMRNEHSDFYDPSRGCLVSIFGQLFLVDLLEKLEPFINLIQSNTDGIMFELKKGFSLKTVEHIAKEWKERTGFNYEFKKFTNFYQRDVNCYVCQNEKREIITRGEAVNYYNKLDQPFNGNVYDAKEPLIITYGIVEYLVYGQLPAQTVDKYKDNLRLFQFLTKKGVFDDIIYIEENEKTGESTERVIQNINRVFANKDEIIKGSLMKVRKEGKVTKSKISSLPNNIFVYNEEILSEEAVSALKNRIDYNYYINRIYERICEFFDIIQIKDINIL